MTSSLNSLTVPALRGSRGRSFRIFSVIVPALVLAGTVMAQTDMAPPPDASGGGGGGGGGGNRRQRGQGGNFDPAQMIARLKDTFGVTSDDEWAIISARLTTVMDLRRSTMGGGMNMRPQGNNPDRPQRQGRTQNPELEALRTAVSENMPDAEIKARLDRFREVKKENEAKLAKAQEDLKAVLTVKQEAIAVMMGMLP